MSGEDCFFVNKKTNFMDLKDEKYKKVFMTYEDFFSFKLKKDTIVNYLNYISENDLLVEGKKLEKYISKLVSFTENGRGKQKDEIYFEDFDFDTIFIDELHVYKNSKEFFGNVNAKYLSIPPASTKGLDAQIKCWLVRQKNKKMTGKEDGIVGFTATPLTNSPLEYYALLTLIIGEENFNKLVGTKSAVDFLENSCEIVQEEDFTVDGREKIFNIFKGIKNLTVLKPVLFKIITFLSHVDLKEQNLLSNNNKTQTIIPEKNEITQFVLMDEWQRNKIIAYKKAYNLCRQLIYGDEEIAQEIINSQEWQEVEKLLNLWHEELLITGSPFNFISKMEKTILDNEESGVSFVLKQQKEIEREIRFLKTGDVKSIEIDKEIQKSLKTKENTLLEKVNKNNIDDYQKEIKQSIVNVIENFNKKSKKEIRVRASYLTSIEDLKVLGEDRNFETEIIVKAHLIKRKFKDDKNKSKILSLSSKKTKNSNKENVDDLKLTELFEDIKEKSKSENNFSTYFEVIKINLDDFVNNPHHQLNDIEIALDSFDYKTQLTFYSLLKEEIEKVNQKWSSLENETQDNNMNSNISRDLKEFRNYQYVISSPFSPKILDFLSCFIQEKNNPKGKVFLDDVIYDLNQEEVKQLVFCDYLSTHLKIQLLIHVYGKVKFDEIAIVTGDLDGEEILNIQNNFNQIPSRILKANDLIFDDIPMPFSENKEKGDGSFTNKKAKEQSFKKEKELKVIIGNEKAEVSLNFQNGTQAIHHLTYGWTPDSLHQRNGRGVRQFNYTDTVNVYHYLTKGSFDDHKRNVVNQKSYWISKIIEKNPSSNLDFVEINNLSKKQYEEMINYIGDEFESNSDGELSKIDVLNQKIKTEQELKEIEKKKNLQKNYLKLVSSFKEKQKENNQIIDFVQQLSLANKDYLKAIIKNELKENIKKLFFEKLIENKAKYPFLNEKESKRFIQKQLEEIEFKKLKPLDDEEMFKLFELNNKLIHPNLNFIKQKSDLKTLKDLKDLKDFDLVNGIKRFDFKYDVFKEEIDYKIYHLTGFEKLNNLINYILLEQKDNFLLNNEKVKNNINQSEVSKNGKLNFHNQILHFFNAKNKEWLSSLKNKDKQILKDVLNNVFFRQNLCHDYVEVLLNELIDLFDKKVKEEYKSKTELLPKKFETLNQQDENNENLSFDKNQEKASKDLDLFFSWCDEVLTNKNIYDLINKNKELNMYLMPLFEKINDYQNVLFNKTIKVLSTNIEQGNILYSDSFKEKQKEQNNIYQSLINTSKYEYERIYLSDKEHMLPLILMEKALEGKLYKFEDEFYYDGCYFVLPKKYLENKTIHTYLEKKAILSKEEKEYLIDETKFPKKEINFNNVFMYNYVIKNLIKYRQDNLEKDFRMNFINLFSQLKQDFNIYKVVSKNTLEWVNIQLEPQDDIYRFVLNKPFENHLPDLKEKYQMEIDEGKMQIIYHNSNFKDDDNNLKMNKQNLIMDNVLNIEKLIELQWLYNAYVFCYRSGSLSKSRIEDIKNRDFFKYLNVDKNLFDLKFIKMIKE